MYVKCGVSSDKKVHILGIGISNGIGHVKLVSRQLVAYPQFKLKGVPTMPQKCR